MGRRFVTFSLLLFTLVSKEKTKKQMSIFSGHKRRRDDDDSEIMDHDDEDSRSQLTPISVPKGMAAKKWSIKASSNLFFRSRKGSRIQCSARTKTRWFRRWSCSESSRKNRGSDIRYWTNPLHCYSILCFLVRLQCNQCNWEERSTRIFFTA